MEALRAGLSACTGGEGYFRELWLLIGLQYAVYWTNRTSRGERDSPFKKVWGKEYEMHANDHVFGSFCMYRVKDIERKNKGNPLSRPGVWVGRDIRIGGHRVVPIVWDGDSGTWELGAVVSVVTAHVEDENFILRKGPRKGMGHGMEAMDKFVECIGLRR